jgi:hypothetical protein
MESHGSEKSAQSTLIYLDRNHAKKQHDRGMMPSQSAQQDVSLVSPCKQFLTVRWLKRQKDAH